MQLAVFERISMADHAVVSEGPYTSRCSAHPRYGSEHRPDGAERQSCRGAARRFRQRTGTSLLVGHQPGSRIGSAGAGRSLAARRRQPPAFSCSSTWGAIEALRSPLDQFGGLRQVPAVGVPASVVVALGEFGEVVEKRRRRRRCWRQHHVPTEKNSEMMRRADPGLLGKKNGPDPPVASGERWCRSPGCTRRRSGTACAVHHLWMGEIHQHCPSGLLGERLAGLTENPFQVGVIATSSSPKPSPVPTSRPFFAGGWCHSAYQLAVGGCRPRLDHLSPHSGPELMHHQAIGATGLQGDRRPLRQSSRACSWHES